MDKLNLFKSFLENIELKDEMRSSIEEVLGLLEASDEDETIVGEAPSREGIFDEEEDDDEDLENYEFGKNTQPILDIGDTSEEDDEDDFNYEITKGHPDEEKKKNPIPVVLDDLLSPHGLTREMLDDQEIMDLRRITFSDENGKFTGVFNQERLDTKLAELAEVKVDRLGRVGAFQSKLMSSATSDEERSMVEDMMRMYKDTLGGS